MSLQFSVGVLCCVCFYWWFIVWSYSLTLGSVCSFTVQCALPQCHHWYEQKNDLSVLSSQLLLSCFLTIGITYWTKYCSLRIWFSQYKRFFSHSYRALLLRVCLRYVCYFFSNFCLWGDRFCFRSGFESMRKRINASVGKIEKKNALSFDCRIMLAMATPSAIINKCRIDSYSGFRFSFLLV